MCGLRARRDLRGPLPLHCPDGEMKIQRFKVSVPSHKESSWHSCHQNLCLLDSPLPVAVAFCFITTSLLPSSLPRTWRLCGRQLPARGIAARKGTVRSPEWFFSLAGRKETPLGTYGTTVAFPQWLFHSCSVCRQIQAAIKALKPKGWNILSRNKEPSL